MTTQDTTIDINNADYATVLRESMDENANLKIQIAALKRTILELQSSEAEEEPEDAESG